VQVDVQQIKDQVAAQAERLHQLNSELRKVIVGQEHMLSRLIIGMLTHGHVLLEGVPGLAKTTAIKALGEFSSRPTCFRPT
jgi:MoxR-like ATPase